MSTKLTKKEKKQFLADGYLILRSKQVRDFKNALKKELKEMSLLILKNHPAGANHARRLKNLTFAEIFDWCIKNEKNNEITRVFYELFPTAFTMIAAVGDPLFVQTSKELGLTHPLPSTLPILRIDRPAESRYLTPAHQDYWYSMLSDNSLTYWLPVLPVTDDMGNLLVQPGSHAAGLLPIKRWTDENPFALRDGVGKDKLIPVNLDEDEVLVFNQFLVHQSGINHSEKARLTLQIRHNDLQTLKKQTTSFTAKHSVYTAQAQKEWLEKSQISGKLSRG